MNFPSSAFRPNDRPSLIVPSVNCQTLLSKALFEHALSCPAIATVATSSKTIHNSSLAPNFFGLIRLTSQSCTLFYSVFYPEEMRSQNDDDDESESSANDNINQAGAATVMSVSKKNNNKNKKKHQQQQTRNPNFERHLIFDPAIRQNNHQTTIQFTNKLCLHFPQQQQQSQTLCDHLSREMDFFFALKKTTTYFNKSLRFIEFFGPSIPRPMLHLLVSGCANLQRLTLHSYDITDSDVDLFNSLDQTLKQVEVSPLFNSMSKHAMFHLEIACRVRNLTRLSACYTGKAPSCRANAKITDETLSDLHLASNLEYLELSSEKETISDKTLERMATLTKLKTMIVDRNTPITKIGWNSVFQNLRNLTHIELEHAPVNDETLVKFLCPTAKKLRRLILLHQPSLVPEFRITDVGLIELGRNQKDLEVLKLDSQDAAFQLLPQQQHQRTDGNDDDASIYDDGANDFSDYFSNLIELHIKSSTRLTFESFRSISQMMPRLKILKLERSTTRLDFSGSSSSSSSSSSTKDCGGGGGGGGIETSSIFFPNLVTLSLDHQCQRVSPFGLQYITQSVQNDKFKNLDWSYIRGPKSEHLRKLSLQNGITSLEFSFGWNVSDSFDDEGLFAIGKAFRNMEKLNLSSNKAICFEFLDEEKFPPLLIFSNLKVLGLMSCTAISRRGFKYIFRRMPKLEKLNLHATNFGDEDLIEMMMTTNEENAQQDDDDPLGNLKSLDLMGTYVTDAGLEKINYFISSTKLLKLETVGLIMCKRTSFTTQAKVSRALRDRLARRK